MGFEILIIEDDQAIAEVLESVFEMNGHICYWAPDGAKGLALARELPHLDLILLDMMMPVMDGLQFLEAYGQKPGPRAPVVAMSAVPLYFEQARRLGVAATISKPMNIEQLLATVTSLAEKRKIVPRPEFCPLEFELDERRLQAILDLRLNEPAPEKALQEFTAFVARLLDMPICAVHIITRTRQFIVAQTGLPPDVAASYSISRKQSFCTHVVAARTPLVVQNAAALDFFKDNYFVRDRGLRFYAGVPLRTRLGDVLGTLCVMDMQPRPFSHLDLELLKVLSRRVVAEIEWRIKQRHSDSPDSSFRYLTLIDRELGLPGRMAFIDVMAIQAHRMIQKRLPGTIAATACAYSELETVAKTLARSFDKAWIGRLAYSRLGVVVPDYWPERFIARVKRSGTNLEGLEACDLAQAAFDAESALTSLEARLDPLGLSPSVKNQLGFRKRAS